MYYCEKCKLLNDDIKCKECEKTPLPPVQANDICFVVQLCYMRATMFKEALKSRNIPVFSVPFGFSLRMKSSDDRNIYVPYEFFNEATDIYDRLFPRTEE